MPRKNAKQRANKMRNTRRVYNGLVAKLSAKTIETEQVPTFYEEDADDRFERHMNSMHKAMERTNRSKT